ncbi:MAG: hypothetical protein AB7F89_12860 [Pirellulaceae bacterium]
MLIPRFSVRWLLFLMSLCAVVAFIVSLGMGGRAWAVALAAMLGTAALMAVLYAGLFCVAWGLARMSRLWLDRRVASSPFATHTPPPQIIAPENPE